MTFVSQGEERMDMHTLSRLAPMMATLKWARRVHFASNKRSRDDAASIAGCEIDESKFTNSMQQDTKLELIAKANLPEQRLGVVSVVVAVSSVRQAVMGCLLHPVTTPGMWLPRKPAPLPRCQFLYKVGIP